MKKKIFTFAAIALAFSFQNARAQFTDDVNVSLSNLSSNNWFDNYDDNTKTVNNLNFEVLSDGNSTLDYVTAFVVKVYIWDGQNPTFVKTYNFDNMHQMSAQDVNNQTIDLSSLSLPAGTYRLGVYVDANDDIPNPPDDPSDNAYLIQGNIDFTPGGSSSAGLITNENNKVRISLFPNPTTNKLTVDLQGNKTAISNLSILNLNGQILKRIAINQNSSYTIDVSNLSQGIYVLEAKSPTGILRKKFVVK